jgi:hypothetical protein
MSLSVVAFFVAARLSGPSLDELAAPLVLQKRGTILMSLTTPNHGGHNEQHEDNQ